MIFLNDYKAFLGIFLAFSATFSWRILGLVLAERISPNGLLIRWVNSVAYSMVAGIMMMILVFPTGILEETTLVSRLISFGAGLLVIFLKRKIFLAIIISLIVFAFVGNLKI